MPNYIIAIDGTAGCGKSTISRALANKIGFTYIKTGEMFRSITYKLIKEKVSLQDEEKLKQILNNLDLKFKYTKDRQISILDGEDITEELNSLIIDGIVSQVSSIDLVRKKVLEFEREAAKEYNIVMEGRDIGTVVFPEADVKIFLTSTIEERTKRRYIQSLESGITITQDEIMHNILFRDEIDMLKENGSLKKADDAIEIVNSNKTIDQVVEEIIKVLKDKGIQF